jgi:chromatin structure-remodeling complex subunit RSC9
MLLLTLAGALGASADMRSAYEISTFHKRQPPPKEILEDVSAKGGDLLNRTVENYQPRISRESGRLANSQDSSDDDEQKTPGQEKMDVEEPGSTGGRVTRCMYPLALVSLSEAIVR